MDNLYIYFNGKFNASTTNYFGPKFNFSIYGSSIDLKHVMYANV